MMFRGWKILLALPLLAAPVVTQAAGPDLAAVKEAQAKGREYLAAAQAADGSWTTAQSPGISGLVMLALLKSGASADDPVIERAAKFLLKFLREDGGIYTPEGHHGNYETSIAIMALTAANQDGRYTSALKGAEKYVRQLQWDETENTPVSDVKYGGSGYGRTGDRPDLSNTLFFLEALEATGATKDDPAVQKALVFLSRCQNLESEHNTTAFAAKVDDGGFYYTPAAGGQSQAGTNPDGGLRSYGSMTYAGLKSMIYAGLTADDLRVKAATDWIRKFYTVSENPGMGQQGLLYYHQVFGKALTAIGDDTFVDAKGVEHDWKKDLAEYLLPRQQSNGSWVNENPRWMEGDPNLATAYSLLALSNCLPAADK